MSQLKIEPYRYLQFLGLGFRIPECDGTLFNAYDIGMKMCTGDQKLFLENQIKNKLKGKVAELVNSRNLTT